MRVLFLRHGESAHNAHTGEERLSEELAGALERVHLLKARFEAEAVTDGDLPLLITHGIFTRFFLLDSIFGPAFAEDLRPRMWHLRSSNCGLTTFEHGEAREPGGAPTVEGWNCVTWMERPWERP